MNTPGSALLIRAERRWSSATVIESLADIMVRKGVCIWRQACLGVDTKALSRTNHAAVTHVGKARSGRAAI
jgi:hypothetical protein